MDQVLHRPLVRVRAVHPLAEVLEPGEGPVGLPLPDHALDEAPADVLDGHQSEPDPLLLHGEGVPGPIHVRRQQGDAHVPALPDIDGDLLGPVEHRCEQSRHVFLGVVQLKPRSLVGHHSVAHRVGLVEGIVGKLVDLVVDGHGHVLGDAVGHAPGDPPLRVAVEEGLLLPGHVLCLLLAHGPADHICLPQGVARQLLENLHHLLLVDDAAVGDGENRLQGRVLVGDQLGVVLAGDEPGDGVHGPRPVQGHNGRQVLHRLGPQPHAHPGHAGGLHLEHAAGLPLGEHLVDPPVVLRDVLQPEVRLPAADHLHRVLQHRQVPQAQKVHLQKAQLLQGHHGVLADRGLVVPGQGHIGVHRVLGDDHAGGVGGGVAGHSLQGLGGIDELFYPLVPIVEIPQGLAQLQGVVQGDVQVPRPAGHLLGHRVHVRVGHVQHPAHVPDGGPGGHGAEGDDLGHPVAAVLAPDVLHHLVPAVVPEVHVNIRHTHPLRIEEPLKVQAVLDGVDVRDAQAVGHHAAGGGAAAGSHGDARLTGKADKVGDNEEVVRKAHLLDHVQFVLQLPAVLRVLPPVTLREPLIAQGADIGPGGLPRRDLKLRQVVLAKGELQIAHLRDPLRVGQGAGVLGEEALHLLGGADVEVAGLIAHPPLVLHHLACLDAQEHVVGLRVLRG